MNPTKALRIQLKSVLNQETTARLLNYLGYEINSSFKFKIREERTPSASIAKDGSIKDFGTGEHFSDVISLMHEKRDVPLGEATQWVAKCLGVPHG